MSRSMDIDNVFEVMKSQFFPKKKLKLEKRVGLLYSISVIQRDFFHFTQNEISYQKSKEFSK